MWEAIAALAAVVALLLRGYLAARTAPPKETPREEVLNEFRSALVERDTDRLSASFDRLRKPQAPGGDGDPGGPDDHRPG